jgi:nucleotide-binding universal stress UspA family protein
MTNAGLGVRTVLTHVSASPEEAPRLQAAAGLARTLDAELYGLAAEMVPPLTTGESTGLLEGDWYVAMRAETARNLDRAAELFTAATAGLQVRWASAEAFPAAALVGAARAADLILAGGSPLDANDLYRHAATAELVLKSGRPVLIAPPTGEGFSGRSVVVGWKDTRESRRALADALPFLVRAEKVMLIAACPADDQDDAAAGLQDVVEGLKRHGIEADGRTVTAPGDRVAAELDVAADALGADLIVTGGYGHSRLGEWVFGGVTRDLLRHPHRYVLMSH